MTMDRKHLRVAWDSEEYWDRIAPSYCAWKQLNYRGMQARDEKKRAERRAKREAQRSPARSSDDTPGT